MYSIYMLNSINPNINIEDINIENIKALAFDLDGTLLGAQAVLTQRTEKAVKACMEKGLKIIISTGRSMASAEPFRSKLGACGPMVYFNGAIVALMPENNVLNTTLLSKEITASCLEISEKKGVYFHFYMEPSNPKETIYPLYTKAANPMRDLYYKNTNVLSEICDVKEILARPEIKGSVKGMFIAEPELLDDFSPFAEQSLGKDVYIVRTTSHYLEVLSPGVSKGIGLSIALDHLGIKTEETIAFGDEDNDVPMIEYSRYFIATDNAKQKVKSKASLVIGPHDKDSIAIFLEKMFLGQ